MKNIYEEKDRQLTPYTEKITANLDSRNFNRFVKNRLNPMLNSLFGADEGEEKDYGKNLRE